MVASYQDMMSIVARHGRPDYFITMTCNPKWREILENLYPGQTASDRPDLVARVFKLKLNRLIEDLTKKHVLGEVSSFVYVVEFQKRGLPHAHILLTMKFNFKPKTTEVVDKVICAELPDPDIDPELYNFVSLNMIHQPCGFFNENASCMKNNKCSKKFPKAFQAETRLTEGYPLYRRRNDGRTVQCRGVILDNRNVVPYNKYLLLKYRAHINVEICTNISAIKYLYKYVYKGSDRARVELYVSDKNLNSEKIDEIKHYCDFRYVCAPESAHRLLGYEMESRSHSIVRLQVHLPGQTTVLFQEGQEKEALEAAKKKDSTLTAWFKLNQFYNHLQASNSFPDDGIDSRNLFYHQIPEYFIFKNNSWERRKNISKTIGRLFFVGPNEPERFALRLLLLTMKGCTSFEDLKTIADNINHTFMDAAIQAGLIETNEFFRESLQEASTFQMPKEMRSLFVSFLAYCHIGDCESLWQEFKHLMSEDFVYRGFTNYIAEALAFQEIKQQLLSLGKHLDKYLTSSYQDMDLDMIVEEENQDYHLSKAQELETLLNDEQRHVFERVLQSLNSDDQNKYFFLDGPGGSGKTFLYNAIYHHLKSKHCKILNVAWTGIAANLLPEGKTACSAFKLCVPNQCKSSTMKRQSPEAQQLRIVDVIIWDECPMAPKDALEAVDVLLRDITSDQRPFGGKVILLGGDFRQILPVVENGGRSEEVEKCIKSSNLWNLFEILHLTVNMRVQDNFGQWQKYLLDIGQGEYEDFLQVPEEQKCHNIEDMIDFIYGSSNPEDDLTHSAILTLTNSCASWINELIQDKLPGEYSVFKSIDAAIKDTNSDSFDVPTEFLNSLSPPSLPPHELKIKTGSIVMLIRNLNVNAGLCNGTRLVIHQISRRVLLCKIANGSRKGEIVMIPKIDLDYDKEDLPFILKRRQFPLRPSFAMTINKSQGQSFQNVGIFFDQSTFSHGQLYVALSRAKTSTGIKICAPENLMKNIVYKEVL